MEVEAETGAVGRAVAARPERRARHDGNVTAPLQPLLDLQQIDSDLDRHRARLAAAEGEAPGPEAAALATAERRLVTATERRHGADDALADLEQRLRDLEASVASAEQRLRQLSDIHQIEAAQKEVELRRAQVGDLEEQTLAAMDEAGAAATEMEAAQSGAEQARQALERAGAERSGELDESRSALAAAEAARPAAVEAVRAVSPEALDAYEARRARGVRVAAARLTGGQCGGCHLTLPATEVDRLRHAPLESVVTCSDCGCILVRSAPAEAPRPDPDD